MHSQHPPTASEPRRPWTTLALVAIAQFMVVLDVTVVNVALPSIGDALGFSASQLQWVVTAYVLVTGGLMLLGGRLADRAGRRRVFLTGLTVFTAASLASGLAGSPAALIASRAAQGLGAAMLLPAALSIVTTTYEGRQRSVALAVWGALASAGAAVGVLVGGALTSALSWEWVFFVNVPVGIAVALLAPRLVPADARQPRSGRQLDLAGGALLLGGLVALLLAVEGASQHGWGSMRTLALAGGGAVLLAAFALVERHGRQPLVPPAVWRIGSLVSSAAVMLVATGILVGTFFLGTLLLQRTMHASPVETGLAFLPLTLAILAGAHLAQHLVARTGTRAPMAAGLLGGAAGAYLLSRVPDGASYAGDLLPGFLVLGLGLGLTFVSLSVAAMADVRHEQAGLASGLMTTAHELGAAIGVAVLAAIATAGASPVDGYHHAFAVAAAVAAGAGAVAAVALPSVRPRPGVAVSMH